jgi:hypothetical protein
MSLIARRLILLCLLLFIGCSGSQPTDDIEQSDQMLNVLKTALDAWKDGTAETLARRASPIRFADDDLAAGRRLIAYRLDDPEISALPFESVFVDLTLQTSDGKKVERTVGYQISLSPALAVLRSEP